MTPPAGPSARSWDAAAIVSVAAALVGDGGSFFSGMEGLSARATAARCNRAFALVGDEQLAADLTPGARCVAGERRSHYKTARKREALMEIVRPLLSVAGVIGSILSPVMRVRARREESSGWPEFQAWKPSLCRN